MSPIFTFQYRIHHIFWEKGIFGISSVIIFKVIHLYTTTLYGSSLVQKSFDNGEDSKEKKGSEV